MKKVMLTMNEHNKYEIIKAVHDNKKSKLRASVTLGVSLRTINRLLQVYIKEGKAGFIHGNRNKLAHNAVQDDISNEILTLYETKYNGYNYTHFSEKLNEDEGYAISESFVRKLLNKNDFISPKAHRKTKRRKVTLELRQKNKNLSEDELNTIIELEIDEVHPSRPRKKNFGELIQMDASDHIWFGDGKSHLHAAIDDATGKIVGIHFDKQETLNGYYQVYSQILHKYGIPYEFITDRRTIFEYTKKNMPSLEKDTFTQFSYACKVLGTHITTTSVPQAKGRIERLFNTLQSRLISELKTANITTITEANAFLVQFVEKFNHKFSLQINDNMNVFEEVQNKEIIDTTLAVIVPRKIDGGSCIKYNNQIYYPERDGERKYFDKRTKVLVIKSLSNQLYCSIGSKMYILTKLPISESISKEFEMPSDIIKRKKKYIPPMNHPWRYNTFQDYSVKQKHLNTEKVTRMFE